MSISPYLSSKKSSLHSSTLELLVPSFELWQQQARSLIRIIAQSDPNRAKVLSRRVLLFKGRFDEKEELRSFGLAGADLLCSFGLGWGWR